jgi:catalase
VHQVVYLFGDRGIPYGVRYMNSYYGHTLKLINKVSGGHSSSTPAFC